MPYRSHPRRAIASKLAILIALGATARAGEAPQPSTDLDPNFAQNLLAARQANARAQHEGRPSVWMAVPSGRVAPRTTGAASPGDPKRSEADSGGDD